MRQLEDFANQVKVPFGYLFLEQAPHEEIPFPVFRGEAGQRQGFDLDVFDTVNGIRQRQEWLSDYLMENGIPLCEIVGIVSLRTPIAETVDLLRRKYGGWLTGKKLWTLWRRIKGGHRNSWMKREDSGIGGSISRSW